MTMDFIQQCMGWNPTPLGARVAFAMARVLAPTDPKRSAELHNHAQDLAVAVGESVADRENVPTLLADEEWLVRGFKYGCEQAERREEHLALYPPIVWSNEWATSLDGIHENASKRCQMSGRILAGTRSLKARRRLWADPWGGFACAEASDRAGRGDGGPLASRPGRGGLQ
jgi:hypothetical protein